MSLLGVLGFVLIYKSLGMFTLLGLQTEKTHHLGRCDQTQDLTMANILTYFLSSLKVTFKIFDLFEKPSFLLHL